MVNFESAARRGAVALGLASACDPATPDPMPAATGLPAIAICDAVREDGAREPEQVQLLLDAVDRWRARGSRCGMRGRFPPAATLHDDPALRCAARVHARELAVRGEVTHLDAQELGPPERALAVGYTAAVVEHLAAGTDDAVAVVDTLWLRDDAICADLLDAAHVDAGAAFVGDVDDAYGSYWVLLLGRPDPA
jgi:uncharacterized protein YkwD